MWGASEEPPEPTGDGPPDPIVHVRETCEQNKNQIENLKEIMLKNKQSLKRKEEEVQEYARRLSKIKSRAKFSRRSKDGASSSTESFSSLKADESISENIAEITDDIGQAKSSKAKSSLLQRKLAENRKVFEQRNKELTETKRVVVEKVEAIRQQLEEQLPVASVISSTSEVNPSLVSVGDAQEKEQKIAELNNKIMELEATIVDLQENLKEKDAVIDSKTKAVALVSADFSKRGKTTLDTLEDTKDEMRSMQENFILLETTLKNKNENLLEQLNERDNRIAVLEDTIKRNEELLQEQKIAETASVDFSRSTLDTLADTKDAMRSMQENFILIESSLKSKNDNLLKQLEERELKLAEANEKIYHLESGAGFIKPPAIEDLQYKLEKLEQNNKQLQEEKYILQKNIAELQDQILINKSDNKTDAIIEKDNRIAELENLIQELKQSNELLEEESKSELQKQVTELSLKNEEYINKINDLEKLVHNLEIEKNDIAARLPDDNSVSKENEKISQLTKELDDLNKTMIKIKAQHRSKLKNLQKQLDSFKKVSDVNAELVKLGNQVTLLEEEKGNLQLSLVDFDELKASAGDWQERIADLESKVSAQEKELQMHITAIGALENQKLDLIQELHSIKREVSDLEAENAESENLRVTAEMKVVDLEEQLESLQKTQIENKSGQVDQLELAKKLELLTQENNELLGRLAKLEEKSTSDTGSTESFENIQEADKTELLKRIEDLTIKNTELTHKLSKIDERASSNAGSTESFETINDTDKNELLKKIDQLTHENSELVMKLSKTEEKGSSDTGSTESFERIPEHSESLNKIELLTQENNDLVIKLYKLEEKLERMECQQESLKMENSESSDNAAGLLADLEKHKAQLNELVEENLHLKQKVEQTIMENNDLVIRFTKLEEKYSLVDSERLEALEKLKLDEEDRVKELEERNDLSMRLSEADARIINLEKANKNLEESLESMQTEKKDIQEKLDYLQSDDYVNERLDLIGKLERLNEERESVAQERQELQEQMRVLLHKSTEELNESRKSDESFSQSSQVPENQSNISDLEEEIKNCKKLIAEQTSTLDEMRIHLSSKEEDLEEKTKLIASMQTDKETYISEISNLRHELKNTEETLTTWQLKCREMEEKLEALNVEKVAIEERLKQLEEENKTLIEESKAKDITAKTLKEEMESVVSSLEQRLQVEINLTSLKEQTIFELRGELESKDQELHEKYTQIQNEMIAIDGLQDELSNYKIQLHEKDMEISKLTEELQTRVEAADKEEKDKNEQLVAQIGSMTQKLHDLENQLTVKTEKISHLTADKNKVLEDLDKANAAFGMSENKYMNLQMDSFRMAEEHMEYNKELRNELADSYRMLEHLKMKHVEDTEMTNQRLNDVLEELNSKLLENEALKSELEEKRNFLEKYVPIDEKLQLETQVSDLEKNLAEARQKSQDQLEKMKKIAANLKKKTTICQELEARVLELEEKWMTEKDEKEAKNKKIQEVESSMKEKDNKITDLEEKLNLARNESAEVTATVEVLSLEATKSKEKLSVLMEQIAEMGDEIEELRNQMKQASADLSAEKQAKQNLLHEYESYKEKVERDKEQDQLVLDEVKENARELNVRMQVMEGEYVDQLAFIKNLQAENGLLVSKQAQINEKLENVEKESEDRRIFIEKIQKEVPVTIGTSTQTLAEDSVTAAADDDDESRAHIEQPFVQCEQCQTIIQALEAKLQERDAEIENLYNEMSNSIVNSFQLPETRRHSDTVDQSNSRNDDSYNELLLHYNALLSSNEELKIKLTEVINENVDLIEKKNQLEERIARIEQELIQGKKEIEAMQESSTAILEPLKVDEDLQRESQGIRQGSKNTREASTLDEPVLFNASEIFGTSQVLDIPDDKITELQNLLSEKETQCVSLTKEIADLKSSFHEEQVAHSELMARFNELEETSRAEIERLQQFLVERDRRIDDINAQLNNASLQFSDELESVAELNSLIQNRNKTIENLKTELANTEGYFKTLELTYRSDVESLEDQMSKLQATIQSSVEDAVAEFKQRAKEASDEKESLVLQVTDLLQTLEETRAAFASQQSLLVQERDQAKELADELKRSLSEYQKSLLEKEQSQIAPEIKEEPVETTVVETVECSKAIDESTEGTSQLGVDLAWDSGSAEKLNVDEEDWGWNAEEAQLASDHPVSLIPSIEVTLNARIEELQDQIKDLEAEKAKLAADSEAVQVRNGKLVKKLKEYKVQMESLQQQLKIQKSASDFGGLDFAIEEELKSQIENLEKTLVEVREGHKQVVAEKSALLKRLDSVSSANENFLEIKKKTDMEIHVLQIQNKELSDKVSTLEGKLREFEKSLPSPFQANTESPVLISSAPKLESETLVTSAPSEDLQSICKKYTDAIDDLKDELEALGTENEQLQQILEEQKTKLLSMESRVAVDANSLLETEELKAKNAELKTILEQTREDYDLLKEQYQQSLSDAETVKTEFTEKSSKYDFEINEVRRQIDEYTEKMEDLQMKLQEAIGGRFDLEEKVRNLETCNEKVLVLTSSLAEVSELLNTRVQEVAELKQELQKQYVIREESEMKGNEVIRALEGDLHAKAKEVNELKRILEERENELMQQKSSETINVIVSEATQELVQKHAIELEDKSVQICALSDQLAAVQHTAEQYSLALQDKSTVIDNLQEEVMRLKQTLEQSNLFSNEIMENLRRVSWPESKTAETDILTGDRYTIEDVRGKLLHLLQLEDEVKTLKGMLSEANSKLQKSNEELDQRWTQMEHERHDFESMKQESQKQIEALSKDLKDKSTEISQLKLELDAAVSKTEEKVCQDSGKVVDGLPVFTMGGSGDYDQDLQLVVDKLKAEMAEKQEEVNHLRYLLDENTYPRILQEMQDNINCLQNERRELVDMIETTKLQLNEKHEELERFKQQSTERDEKSSGPRERRSLEDQEQIVKLQNELHELEQEINELKYIIREKDSQLAVQAMEPQTDDYELRNSIDSLTSELYSKEQEIQQLRTTIAELQNEVSRLQHFEHLSYNSQSVIEQLSSEKEQVRLEAERYLEQALKEKELEIQQLQQRLYTEKQEMLESLQLRNNDVQNLKIQIEQSSLDWADRLRYKEDELHRVSDDLAEKERRLAELSITKDAELHNLRVQIHEKDVRIEELLMLTEEEEKQLAELRQVVDSKEAEINVLKGQLEEKIKEYDLIQHALKKDISIIEAQVAQSSAKMLSTESGEMTSNELDLALYMLHQRDVRCEELTHELMQLLEERDTLQLRLSNAIRMNEELRKTPFTSTSPKKEAVSTSEESPIIEEPSPSKSEGPVEIAREAIDISLGEDKEALAEKLSQLHTVGHARDVRLRDERELRHTQQMSLLAHKDVLSTLPPEAAARLVNANYTLSRDVQSQSSVLMNWLWGKSTPKVVHM